MSSKKTPRGVGCAAAGALVAAALIPLAAAPAAPADPGDNPIDQAVDTLYLDIANFFSPEPAPNAFAIDNVTDLFAPEGTQLDQAFDGFYQDVNTAFQPEGPIDMFIESVLGLPAL